MTHPTRLSERFVQLHRKGEPLLLANVRDAGVILSARAENHIRGAEAVEVPVNVLCRPGGPTVPELAQAGVARISVGGGFYFAPLGALATAAREWREQGTHEFWKGAAVGIKAAHSAFE